MTAAPPVSVTSLVAGSGAAALVASQIASVSLPRLLLVDVANDGFGTSRRVTTTLAGGGAATVDWTQTGDDDAFVALDTALLRAKGFGLADAAGGSIGSLVLARSGLRITAPNGTTTTTADAFQLLRVLDLNADLVLTPADPAFAALRIFRDTDGDGIPDSVEQQRLSDAFKGALEDLGDTSADLSLDLQAVMTRIAQATQIRSVISAKDAAAKDAVIGNIRG